MFEQFMTTIESLNRDRKISIYLPCDYHSSNRHYPVVYMHDAQNLFNDTIAFGGQSWRVQQYLNQPDLPKAIVVAIDNHPTFRLDEYSPFPISDYGQSLVRDHSVTQAQGIAYIDWLASGLKPVIDQLYRTLPEADQTAIVGSSMGGLISLYAGIAYPDIFANLGVLSPAFWFCKPAITEFLALHPLPQTSRVFMSVGTSEGGGIAHDEDYLLDAIQLKTLLLEQNCQLNFSIIPDGHHHESAWEPLTKQWSHFFKITQ
ncbi:MAG: alpha/beta hydrolase [Culicoidibacterales bacterium]